MNASKIIPLPNWGSIQLSGDDCRNYLNGQVTCPVAALAEGQASFGAHTDAKGKSWSHFYLVPSNDTLQLFQRRSTIEKSAAELQKYAVFAKAEVIDSSEELSWYALVTDAAEEQEKNSGELHKVTTLGQGQFVQLNQNIALFVGKTSEPLPEQLASLPQGEEGEFELALIKNIIPFIHQQHQGEFVPQMLNLHALDGISFNKGCYMGQETVARMRFLGKNKRAVFAFKGQAEQLNLGDTLEQKLDQSWRRAGNIVSYSRDQDCYYGLAVFAADIDPASQLRLKDTENSQFELLALPYSLDYKET